jgi:hypothetical protein
MCNKLEGMWRETAVASFKILSCHLPRGTEEIYENYVICELADLRVKI